MQARIRIIKRSSQNGMNGVSANPIIKSDRERERETVNTVKTWVADWEQRKRSLQNAAEAIIRSLDRGSENTTKEFAVVS
jgi:transcription initiation factor IIE alpha subunit